MNDDLLLEYLEQIITGILGTVDSTNWLDDAASTAALQQIHNLLDQFGVEVQQVLPFQMILQYFGGVDEATNALVEAGDDIPPTLAITENGLIAAPFQKVIHTNAVEKIVDDSMMDMSAAINTAKAYAVATIGTTLATVKSDIAKGMIKGDPWKATQMAVMESFRKDGMTAFQVTDKNGVVRNLPLRFYAMTVVRTKSREASVQGSKNRYIDAGHDLTQITGNGDSCEVCAKFNGLVVSMTGKTKGYPAIGENGIRLGPYHPNCRCGHRIFMEKFATDEEIKKAKARNKKYKPNGDPRTAEEKAAYEEEQRKRRVANAEAKQFARWQEVLGAEAPASIGAFRAMKRKNSPKFQELQSAYLSATHTKMASPEQIKAADDAAILKAKQLKEAEAAEAKAKADAAAAKKAKEDAEFKLKEQQEAEKLAKKQAAMKKAQADLKAKKEAEAQAALEAAEAQAKADKMAAYKQALKGNMKPVDKAQEDLDKAVKEAKEAQAAADKAKGKAAAEGSHTAKILAIIEKAKKENNDMLYQMNVAKLDAAKAADALAAAQMEATKLRRGSKLPKVVGEPKVATNVRELRDLFKQGDEMEEDTWKYVAAKHKDMPDIGRKIEKLKKYRETWMGTSVKRSSAALQDFYARAYGLPYKPMSNIEADERAAIDEDMIALLDTQRDLFQEKLKSAGYTHIRIYRGVSWDDDEIPGWFPTNYDENGYTKVNDNEHGRALTSWSFDPSSAAGFARSSRDEYRAIQEVDLQVEQIWSAFGLGREREIVPLGLIENVKNAAMSGKLIEKLGEPSWADDLYDPNDTSYEDIYYND